MSTFLDPKYFWIDIFLIASVNVVNRCNWTYLKSEELASVIPMSASLSNGKVKFSIAPPVSE